MTASVYLHGKLAREPFTRAELQQRQPVYYRFLTPARSGRSLSRAPQPGPIA